MVKNTGSLLASISKKNCSPWCQSGGEILCGRFHKVFEKTTMKKKQKYKVIWTWLAKRYIYNCNALFLFIKVYCQLWGQQRTLVLRGHFNEFLRKSHPLIPFSTKFHDKVTEKNLFAKRTVSYFSASFSSNYHKQNFQPRTKNIYWEAKYMFV